MVKKSDGCAKLVAEEVMLAGLRLVGKGREANFELVLC